MKIAFIVDGRTEHARRWIQYFVDVGDEVLILSTYPFQWDCPVTSYVLPGVFRPGSAFTKSAKDAAGPVNPVAGLLVRKKGLDNIVRPIWQRLNALDALWQGRRARAILRDFRPDVVHAMRIQNEGYVAAIAGCHPWIVSVWGQDFNYFARHYGIHRWATKRAIPTADALTADCRRDIRLAHEHGLLPESPTAVFPGNGGVDPSVFTRGKPVQEHKARIVYARGFGPYLRLENLMIAFRDLESPCTLTLIGPPAQLPRFRELARSLGIARERYELLPYMDKHAWARLLQSTRILVSPSTSDGTPNTMLECMACGTLPVIGDIESIREWIEHGVNGLLFDPERPSEIRSQLQRALDDERLFVSAADANREIIEQRADRRLVMPAIRRFYETITAEHEESLLSENR